MMRDIYNKNLIVVDGGDTYNKWLAVTLLESYRYGKLNVKAFEVGSHGYYHSLVCLEHLRRLYPAGFPSGPLPRFGKPFAYGGRVPLGPLRNWFQDRNLNMHLRDPTFSPKPDLTIRVKAQVRREPTHLVLLDI